MFKSGKLYHCPEFFLFIYSSMKEAGRAHNHGAAGFRKDRFSKLTREVGFWSEHLRCRICYSDPGEVFMFLQQDGDLLYVLFGEKHEAGRSGPTLGWIANREYLGIVEAENGF